MTQPHLLLYCFRGGQRSSIVQSWLREQGLEVPRIQGGYKFVRRRLAELLDEAVQESCFVSVSGMTGAGKTRLLRQTLSLVSKARILDLEHLANHKGSAFGKELSPQPSQPSFEMALAVQLVKLKGSDPIYVEDEARTLGKITLPSSLFQKMRACPLLLIEESLSFRVQTIIEDYLVSGFQNRRLHGFAPQEAHDNLFQNMSNNILRISKKLGSLRTKEALTLLQESFRSTQIKWTDDLNWTPHAPWIQFLLENYYDPYYQEHLLRQSHRPLVKVSWEEALKKLSLSSTSGE